MKISFFFSINTVIFRLGQHTMKLNESLFKQFKLQKLFILIFALVLSEVSLLQHISY